MFLSVDRIRPALASFFDLQIFSPSVYLAGGAIRSALNNEPLADYDVFFRDAISSASVAVALELAGYEIIFRCPVGKLTSYKHPESGIKVQLITEFFYPSLETLIDSFDITACRFATDGSTLLTVYSAIRDSKKKNINLHRIDYPVATLKRIIKYTKKGYTLTNLAAKHFTESVYQKGLTGAPLDSRIYID